MIVKRYVFFILLLLLVIAPYIATRLCWILSAKETKGKIAFIGKDISAQLPRSYSVVMFSSTGSDTVFLTAQMVKYGKRMQLFLYYISHPIRTMQV
ncbi:MAG: hypothetical protein QM668_12200 [Agriterribacter sp.]